MSETTYCPRKWGPAGHLLMALLAGLTGCLGLTHIDPAVPEDLAWREVRAPATLPQPRTTPTEPGFSVAVMDVRDSSSTFDAATLHNATEMLRGRLSAAGRFIVIDKSRQEAKLKALVRTSKKDSYAECYDKKCQIPLGQALAADSILRSTISCLGSSCQLSLELVDLGREAAIAGAIADFEASPEGLVEAIREAANDVTR